MTRQEKPLHIICCGGHTQQKTAPGVSEAGLMAEYISAQFYKQDLDIFFQIYKSESSYTTYYNILYASYYISQLFASSEKPKYIIIVCGYGCHLNTPLKPYLDRVVKFVKENQREISSIKSDRIVIFCEATRSANVMQLARAFLLPFVKTIDDITLETGSWERADPFKQAGNLIYNRAALKWPWLGLAEREQRRRMERAKQR